MIEIPFFGGYRGNYGYYIKLQSSGTHLCYSKSHYYYVSLNVATRYPNKRIARIVLKRFHDKNRRMVLKDCCIVNAPKQE